MSNDDISLKSSICKKYHEYIYNDKKLAFNESFNEDGWIFHQKEGNRILSDVYDNNKKTLAFGCKITHHDCRPSCEVCYPQVIYKECPSGSSPALQICQNEKQKIYIDIPTNIDEMCNKEINSMAGQIFYMSVFLTILLLIISAVFLYECICKFKKKKVSML